MKKIQNFRGGQKPLVGGLQASTKTNHSGKGLLYSLVAGAIAIEAYLGLVRPWILHWGATNREVKGWLPGDNLIDHPRYNATHAITINTPAASVWPWLVQIGQGRGGFYSYDWLENLIGCDIHNADQVLPQFQDLKVDSLLRLAPPPVKAGIPDFAFKVAVLEPEHALVIVTPGRFEDTAGTSLPFASWAFILEQEDETTCRLIVRFRSIYHLSFPAFLINQGLLEPIHFIMERKMLLGIKERVEGTAGNPENPFSTSTTTEFRIGSLTTS